MLGVVIFVIVAVALIRPLDRIGELSQSVEEQRVLLVDSMVQGETTIREMAAGVRRMDTSLTQCARRRPIVRPRSPWAWRTACSSCATR